MQAIHEDPLQAILAAYGFEGWASRQEGRRLRCPHGLLIGPAEECPVGCISPLVVMGLLDLVEDISRRQAPTSR
jgi:hypothetical protein